MLHLVQHNIINSETQENSKHKFKRTVNYRKLNKETSQGNFLRKLHSESMRGL